MPVMQVRRADVPREFYPAFPVPFPIERVETDFEELLEVLDAICSGEGTDYGTDTPVEQQRKLRIRQ